MNFSAILERPLSSETMGRRQSDHRLAIRVNNVTLRYPVGQFDRPSLKASLFSLFGQSRPSKAERHFAAISDISFSISHGERVALIGRNGAGKSTMLRMLAGVYPIIAGNVEVFGRIGALLDIGLGVELEATGRENIYYRGMAMGYSRKRLNLAADDIIAFADIGDFIDMPLRTYSTGMRVRLGFAISTQFSPEVFLVDELFGAGDVDFATRAMQRMMRLVENSGIFVIATHDLDLVRRVCTRVLWLEKGRIRRDGPPGQVIDAYKNAAISH